MSTGYDDGMHYIDIHTHVHFAAFQDDRDDVMRRAREAGVAMINVGTQIDTSRSAVELAHQYSDGVYAAIGLHPIHTSPSFHDTDELGEEGKPFTSRGEVFDAVAYRALAQDPRVVAIGECGLDYYRVPDTASKLKQVKAFEAQVAFAETVGKPLMLHLRSGEGGDAYRDALDLLKHHDSVAGNCHFFAGTLDDARKFWDRGFSTSFTGVVTFTDAYDEVVRAAPADLIHAETDAPYVAPKPYRGKRNEPSYVVEVAARLAEIRGVARDAFAAQLRQNAARLFGVTLGTEPHGAI